MSASSSLYDRYRNRTARTIELIGVLAPRELRVRYRQSILDIAWALVSPLVILAVYGYILTSSFDVDATCAPYLSSAWAGLVVWTFFSNALGTSVTSMISSAELITKVYFPREAIPLSVVVATLADLGIGLVTLIVLALAQGASVSLEWIEALLPLGVIVLWTLALSTLFAVVAAFARDVVHAVHLGLRVGFFASPVMYESSFLPSALEWTSKVNPVAVSINGLRDTLLCGQSPDVGLQLIHLGAGAGFLVLTMLYTSSVESRLTDVV